MQYKLITHFLCIPLALSASLATAETVTVRSGNGNPGGRDSAVTFLQGPANTDFTYVLGQSDFSSAQTGPAAYILVNRNPEWVSGLSADPSAKWIGTNANAGVSQGSTGLYAVKFTISNPFTSAALVLNYAVDDGLGTFNAPLYVNGTVICWNLIATSNQFTQQHSLTCDVSSLLQVGTNWLYLDDVNAAGPAGLLFSATITTTNVVVPSINQGGIVNPASSSPLVAAGGLASIYGSFPVTSPTQAAATPWPIDS